MSNCYYFIDTAKSPFEPNQAQANESVKLPSELEKTDLPPTGTVALATVALPDLGVNNVFSTISTHIETATTTATTTVQIASNKDSLKEFQIAKGILSVLQQNGVTSDQVDVIEGFISKYDLTKDWPAWKKQVIVRHIKNMLDKNNPSAKQSVNRRSTRRWSRSGFRRWFDGRRKRSATNETSGAASILDAMKNLPNVLTEVEYK